MSSPNQASYLETRHSGHIHIQYDYVWPQSFGLGHSLRPIYSFADYSKMWFRFQNLLHHPQNHGMVISYQNTEVRDCGSHGPTLNQIAVSGYPEIRVCAKLILLTCASPICRTPLSISMHGGKIVDAVIKAVLDTTDGLKYQVDFGKDQTATISERQIVKA